MDPGTTQRKASLLGPSRTIQPPFQWLVLLHPSIDFPLVALIIVCKVKSFQKSSRNPSKILLKSTKIGPKSCPKSMLDPKRVPKPSRTRFFRFFIDFLSPRGLPKSSQNHEKSKKSDEKSMSKKHMVFNIIFSRFFMVLASENGAVIDVFSMRFRKRWFC